MVVAEYQPGAQPLGEGLGMGGLLREVVQVAVPFPVQLLFGKQGIARHVGEKRHGRRQLVGQHVHSEPGRFEIHGLPNDRAQAAQGLVEVQRAVAARALVHDLQHELGHPAPVGGIVHAAGFHVQRDRYLGQVVLSDDQHFQAVVQPVLVHLRRLEGRIRPERGNHRPVERAVAGRPRRFRAGRLRKGIGLVPERQAVTGYQPPFDRFGDLRSGEVPEPVVFDVEVPRIGLVGIRFVQPVRLAAEAADAFQAGHVLVFPHGAGALHLVPARPARCQFCDLSGDQALHLLPVTARADGRDDAEQSGDLLGVIEDADLRAQPPVVDQQLFETGGQAVSQHGSGRVEGRFVGVEPFRRGPDHVDAGLGHAVGDLHDLPFGQGRHPAAPSLEQGTRFQPAVEMLHAVPGEGLVEIAGDDQREVVRRVVGAEELGHLVHRGRFQVLVPADDGPGIGMAGGIEVLVDQLVPAAVGLVLRGLAALVADDFALVLEVLLRERVSQRGDAVGFQPEHVFEVARGHGGEVVGPVVARGAVDAAFAQVAARLFDVLEIPFRRMLRPFEHQMLEEMGEPRPPRQLHLGAHVEPVIDVHHGQLAVDVQDDLQPVRQGVFLEVDPREVLLGHGSSRE